MTRTSDFTMTPMSAENADLGDPRASVTLTGGGDALDLVRKDGQWYIVDTGLSAPRDDADAARAAAEEKQAAAAAKAEEAAKAAQQREAAKAREADAAPAPENAEADGESKADPP